MVYRIGTMREVKKVANRIPDDVFRDLVHFISILDSEYGEDRDYFTQGGYCILAETEDDVEKVREVIDYQTHLFEFARYIGKEQEFVSILYLLGDDFGIIIFMPSVATPGVIATQIHDRKKYACSNPGQACLYRNIENGEFVCSELFLVYLKSLGIAQKFLL